ncbi:MAG: KH domain-containing protein [Candidatus Adlerbacteria bacterium]|nr:KH domain-containing protein [Candidatus Adlerbacteria bacterium]
MTEKDQEFLEFVVKGLVDNPDDVKIVRTVDEMGVLLMLDLNADDMGKVIGRSGNTAKAIRTLLRVVGMKHNARVNLKINEPAGGMRSAEAGGGSAATGWDGSHAAEVATSSSPVMKTVDQAMEDLGNF